MGQSTLWTSRYGTVSARKVQLALARQTLTGCIIATYVSTLVAQSMLTTMTLL